MGASLTSLIGAASPPEGGDYGQPVVSYLYRKIAPTARLLEHSRSLEVSGLHNRHAIGVDVFSKGRIHLIEGKRLDLFLNIGIP